MSQPPLVILPHGLGRDVGPIRMTVRPPRLPKPPDEWIQFAHAIQRMFPGELQYAKAVEYLLALVAGRRGRCPVPPLPRHNAAASGRLPRDADALGGRASIWLERMLPPGKVRIVIL